VDKPRRLPSTRRAVTDDRLAENCQAAADGGDDPELDTLLLPRSSEEPTILKRVWFGPQVSHMAARA
jgi:hypothetical protein